MESHCASHSLRAFSWRGEKEREKARKHGGYMRKIEDGLIASWATRRATWDFVVSACGGEAWLGVWNRDDWTPVVISLSFQFSSATPLVAVMDWNSRIGTRVG
jgi:hypothetical protein